MKNLIRLQLIPRCWAKREFKTIPRCWAKRSDQNSRRKTINQFKSMLRKHKTNQMKVPVAASLKATQAQAHRSPLRSSPLAKRNATVSTPAQALAALGPTFSHLAAGQSQWPGQLSLPNIQSPGRKLARAVARRSGREDRLCSHM